MPAPPHFALDLVGIGSGNPDHLTFAAVKALNRADLILLPRKGAAKADLADLRRAILAEVLRGPARVVEFDLPRRAEEGDYIGAVAAWHAAIAEAWAALARAHLPEGGRVALMVWGDPSLYDSTLRIAARLAPAGMAVTTTVVPGITSLQVLTAAHAIPLNALAAPVLITTGRRLRETGWPAGADTLAVMLDAGGAFEVLDPAGVRIWWGAYLGMAQQCLIRGALGQVAGEILQTRAALRAEHGWIMDLYLLRRGEDAGDAG